MQQLLMAMLRVAVDDDDDDDDDDGPSTRPSGATPPRLAMWVC